MSLPLHSLFSLSPANTLAALAARFAQVLIILKRRDDTIDKLNSLVEELSERNVQDRSTADTVRDRLQGEVRN